MIENGTSNLTYDPLIDALNDAILAGRSAELQAEYTQARAEAGRMAASGDHRNALSACNRATELRREIALLEQQLEGK